MSAESQELPSSSAQSVQSAGQRYQMEPFPDGFWFDFFENRNHDYVEQLEQRKADSRPYKMSDRDRIRWERYEQITRAVFAGGNRESNIHPEPEPDIDEDKLSMSDCPVTRNRVMKLQAARERMCELEK